jgi:ribosome-associated translation inhibitor RaiA
MTYPDSAGFQAHSETSLEAAQSLQGADTLRELIFKLISSYGIEGRTADEVSQMFNTPASTIGARLRELELKNKVVKTAKKRKTRYDRNAFVYVTPCYFSDDMGRAQVKAEKPADILKLEAEHTRMKKIISEVIDDLIDYDPDPYTACDNAVEKLKGVL